MKNHDVLHRGATRRNAAPDFQNRLFALFLIFIDLSFLHVCAKRKHAKS
jgi:hypothetical protein